ncbi:ribosomal protein L31e-domain-containing protein [Kockovaella imperatae]|uniref:Ribosomal protein L31e-domain-containing protein n=1 Tax=Kockovaella imperatae TaxID=4999 RepID=A0A1Y1UVK6_9TREE|nr:ribosomal protein L31e-domain-containing protein [Kockovaella imperatae]ORX41265.1 ribosomal protein L31e-domain-containing protein [Kockovaella imperatae]
MAPTKKERKTRSALHDVVTREYTVHLHKRVHGTAFKRRAPKAIKAITEFAQKSMGVKDVRISPGLNQAIWSRGIKSPPRRVRVRLDRKRNDDEGAKEKLYVLASVVEGVTNFKGLETVVVEAEE